MVWYSQLFPYLDLLVIDIFNFLKSNSDNKRWIYAPSKYNEQNYPKVDYIYQWKGVETASLYQPIIVLF